jgi:hypothetical protein
MIHTHVEALENEITDTDDRKEKELKTHESSRTA